MNLKQVRRETEMKKKQILLQTNPSEPEKVPMGVYTGRTEP